MAKFKPNLTLMTPGFTPWKIRERDIPAIPGVCEKIPGIQYIYHFDNGWGASVIKKEGSYGYENDLWELGVLKQLTQDDWEWMPVELTGDDVLGYLSPSKVIRVLEYVRDGKVSEEIEDLYAKEDSDEEN